MKNLTYIAALLFSMTLLLTSGEAQERADERERMVETQLKERDITDERVLEAMGTVPRHLLVPEDHRNFAYADRPLPIGHSQTISQPYIVAKMTQELNLEPDDKVLEIGAGSGYHASVISRIVDEVYTIEIIEGLSRQAKEGIAELGYDNIEVKYADGYYGWEEHAPFDAIVVTAGAEYIPPPLIEQLQEGGKMIIPVGNPYRNQNLTLVRKEDGEKRTETLMPVRFVPFQREED